MMVDAHVSYWVSNLRYKKSNHHQLFFWCPNFVQCPNFVHYRIGIINADFVRSTNNKILRRVVSCYR